MIEQNFEKKVIDYLEIKYPQFKFFICFMPISCRYQIEVANAKTFEILKSFLFDCGWYDNEMLFYRIIDIVSDYINKQTKETKSIHYCTACGAPLLKGQDRCAYCGCDYY